MTYAETPIIHFSMGNFVRPIVMLVLKWDSLVVKEIEKLDNPNLGIEGESDPYELFMYALNTDLTKEEYITRLKKLLEISAPILKKINSRRKPRVQANQL
jgi:hypothetical protein